MERSFRTEVELLRLGAGAVFRGEGILAVTKALLQSGVSYVGGYQGAPVSHLIDVMVEAEDLLGDLGVHVETCTNEAAAAAMLGASINYPVRGAVTWKSIVGTNVAADALSNLASPGVIGGALIVIGEDYGEGASVIQERSYAFAMKSSLWLLDPRPDLPTIVRMVEAGFDLSEASHAPVMLELRIRACHVTGEFIAKDNRPAAISTRHRLKGPPRFDYSRLAHPPLTFVHERRKVEERLPAACRFIREHGLNELIAGDLAEIGIISVGGLTNGVLRALERLGLAAIDGSTRVPLLVLNCVYPLVSEEVRGFCAGKRAVLVVEEGHPDYIAQQVEVELRRADIATRVFGKGVLPKTGEYTADVLIQGIAEFLAAARPAGFDTAALPARAQSLLAHRSGVAAMVGALPPRPPTFCTGCPERPVFAAIKLAQRELGPIHVSADIGCHSFATFAPFSLGNSILGYGMSLASAAAVAPALEQRPIAVMGDGGFWHNGVITGVASNLFNRGDGILVVMQNGYTSATGQQYLPSSAAGRRGPAAGLDIERTLRSFGVTWLRKLRSYGVAGMVAALKEAMRSGERGLKVIIADGECQLARQRRVRAEDAAKLARGARVVKTRYGVDDAICTGDRSCIRLSGCPSLTVKPNPDPLRTDPVTTVIESCVGCGLCGEVAHAAVLCPSFYRVERVQHARRLERLRFALRNAVIGHLGAAHAGAGGHSVPASSGRPGDSGGPLAGGLLAGGPAETQSRSSGPAAAAVATGRPVKLLIAALGGEGGGVLSDWIVAAAQMEGLFVQSTSIPGVAQRTGATTYYIEMLPAPATKAPATKAPATKAPVFAPVFALAPGVGDVDVLVASELMEAARTVAAGYATADKTMAIASTARFYAMDEKIAMGDGRADSGRLLEAIRRNSRAHLLVDMAAIARRSGAFINAVMLGLIAGSGAVPIAAARFESVIRERGSKADLAGFAAGLAAAQGEGLPMPARDPAPVDDLPAFAGDLAEFPAPARAILRAGVQRLIDYQDADYARLYLERLAPLRSADAQLLGETARHLALRMSYEDVIRVAQAKIDPARIARIRSEVGAKPGEPVKVFEFLKPGVAELCSVLPPALARRILGFAGRHRRLADHHWGMEIETTSVAGHLRLRLIAALRRLRRRTHRYAEEQREIERWLAAASAAAERSRELALAVAGCASLIRGYGDTHARGSANYRLIEQEVIVPALAGRWPPQRAADALASACSAALVDPEGESLRRCLDAIAKAPPLAAE